MVEAESNGPWKCGAVAAGFDECQGVLGTNTAPLK